jgi:hypothetical protein
MNAKERESAHESESLAPFNYLRSFAFICGLVFLSGCTLRSQKPAAVPPAPQPAAVQAPAPEPQLSIPQTTAQLPSPQPVNPDAIPAAPAEEPPAPEKEAPRTTRRPPVPPVTGAPKPESEPPPAQPENAAEPAPFQPILTAAEQTRLRNATEARRREIDERLARAKGHLSSHDQTLADRIDSFLTLSAQAAQRGDYTQADALSERALILARELKIE